MKGEMHGRRFGISYPKSEAIQKSQEETNKANSKLGTVVLGCLAMVLCLLALVLILVLGTVFNLYRMTKDVATGVGQVTGIVEFLEGFTEGPTESNSSDLVEGSTDK